MTSISTLTEQLSSFTQSMEVLIAIVTISVSFLLYTLIRRFTSNVTTPPGPWGLPILGHLPFLGKEPNVTFMKMREKFGDIFQIQMGSWTAVVVNGKQSIREALQNSGDDFSGRPQFLSSTLLRNGVSMTFGPYNEDWRLHHKLSQKVLAEFSNVKKNPIQENVHEETDILINSFMSLNGGAFDPHGHIVQSVASIIYQVCYGRDVNIRESGDFNNFIHNADEFTKFLNAGNPVDVLPWLQYLMPSKLAIFSDLINRQSEFSMKKVNEHRQNFSSDCIRDITDALIVASREETKLSENRIMSTIEDIFGAGFETVTQTLRWAVLLMAAHPDVQKRVQAEIDDVIGSGLRPGNQDRGRLVYTEAVLHEINRYTSLVPLAVPHFTTKNTTLFGYRIKKDTVVFINLYSMSHDKSVWGDPEVFRPERFLDESGQIKKPLLEEFLPFSAGRRKCIGESLARMEIFLFFSGLLQKCSIVKPSGTEYSMDTRFGLTRECLPYTVKIHLRN